MSYGYIVFSSPPFFFLFTSSSNFWQFVDRALSSSSSVLVRSRFCRAISFFPSSCAAACSFSDRKRKPFVASQYARVPQYSPEKEPSLSPFLYLVPNPSTPDARPIVMRCYFFPPFSLTAAPRAAFLNKSRTRLLPLPAIFTSGQLEAALYLSLFPSQRSTRRERKNSSLLFDWYLYLSHAAPPHAEAAFFLLFFPSPPPSMIAERLQSTDISVRMLCLLLFFSPFKRYSAEGASRTSIFFFFRLP